MIVIILGLPGSGKTSLQEELIQTFDYGVVKELTDRPKRSENDGEYVFVDDSRILNTPEDFVNISTYKIYNGEEWHYGLLKAVIDFEIKHKEFKSALVTNAETAKALLNNYPRDLFFIVYLDIEPDICAKRLHDRDTTGAEVTRRIKEDGFDLVNFFKDTKPDYHITKEYPLDELARGIDYTISFNQRFKKEK